MTASTPTEKINPKTAQHYLHQLMGLFPQMGTPPSKEMLAGIVTLFCEYPELVVKSVCNPVVGLPSKTQFLPTLATLKEALEVAALSQQKTERLKALPRPARLRTTPIDLSPGVWANVFVPSTDRRYQALCEKAKTADLKAYRYGKDTAQERDGIWVNHEWIVGGVVMMERRDWGLSADQLDANADADAGKKEINPFEQ